MDLSQILPGLLTSINNGAWRAVAAFVIILLVFLVRTYGPKLWPKLEQGKMAIASALTLGGLWSLGEFFHSAAKITVGAVIVAIINGLVVGAASAGIVKAGKEWTPGTIQQQTPPPK